MFKASIQKLASTVGYQIVPTSVELPKDEFPADMEKEFEVIYNKCKDFTMTSRERMYAVYKATCYIIDKKVPGDFVECGVWKGGSSMVMAYTLLLKNDTTRKIYLYDTYEGMTEPSEKDVAIPNSEVAHETWSENRIDNSTEASDWCASPVEEVENNMKSTGYPESQFVYVKGKVEDTIPGTMPERIALLRLDTDWFESTYHEMVHMYPNISTHGVLALDDYGYWAGAKEAVDKYFSENSIAFLLNRIDSTGGRIGIKST